MRRLLAIVGEAALSPQDRLMMQFSDRFEREFVGQGPARRTVTESLELAWRLLEPFADDQLGRIPAGLRDRYGRGRPREAPGTGGRSTTDPSHPGSRR